MTGTSNTAEHQIKMMDDKPIKQRYYPNNSKIQGEVNTNVDELLQMGFIELSKSPYISPIVMVKKKTGKWRLCVDFRQINAKSVKDAYPMPRINYILDQLRKAWYISSLDLRDVYWQTVPGLYDKKTLGTGRATKTPEENASKLAEVFEIVRRNMEKASHYNLRRRQWSPAVGDIVWAKEHNLSKAGEGFAAKLAPRYDGPYQVVDFVSPVICKIRRTHSKKERTVHVGELKQQQNRHIR